MPPKKVLIIDDNENLADGMETIIDIHMDTVEAITAYTGTDGIRKAIENRPDLVFLDMNLPDMNGKEVLSGIRRTFNPTVVILSGEIDPPQLEGASGYILKPVKPAVLVNLIEEQLGL